MEGEHRMRVAWLSLVAGVLIALWQATVFRPQPVSPATQARMSQVDAALSAEDPPRQ
jgi:hypothetical protein